MALQDTDCRHCGPFGDMELFGPMDEGQYGPNRPFGTLLHMTTYVPFWRPPRQETLLRMTTYVPWRPLPQDVSTQHRFCGWMWQAALWRELKMVPLSAGHHEHFKRWPVPGSACFVLGLAFVSSIGLELFLLHLAKTYSMWMETRAADRVWEQFLVP